uniref:Copine domain-containing protein n=1 Tax=Heligmosomoides polygyrus TaxID=6339 RepID=A0A183F6X2_HELPZ
LRDAQEPFTLTNPGYKSGQKVCAQFELVKCTELTICSFLDYINFGVCLRSNNFAAYGFGARIPPLFRESHEFCLNLETDPTCSGVDGVVTAFQNTYMQTQPCASAHFAHVIYHLSKIAQIAVAKSDQTRPQYHILNIITRGAIDDVKETVQAAIFASKSPISIIFTGIGDRNLDEIERLGGGGKRLVFQGRKSDRDNLHFVNMTRVLLECDGSAEESKFTLSEKSLYQIPRQIASYFTKNGILPLDRQETSPVKGECAQYLRQLKFCSE